MSKILTLPVGKSGSGRQICSENLVNDDSDRKTSLRGQRRGPARQTKTTTRYRTEHRDSNCQSLASTAQSCRNDELPDDGPSKKSVGHKEVVVEDGFEDLPKLQCQFCSRSFKYAGHLSRHERSHVNVTSHNCTSCSLTFHSLQQYEDHLAKLHDSEDGHNYVNSSTTDKGSTTCVGKNGISIDNGHSKLVTGLNCIEMHDRVIETTVQARPAQKAVDDESKDLKCQICGTTFARIANLKIHLRLHSGEKPYSCSVCSKSFTRSDHLKNHELCHSKVKPFTCDHCGESFKRADHLKYHKVNKHGGTILLNELKTYTKADVLNESKTILCDMCGSSFSDARGLRNHLKKHSFSQKFSCQTCGKTFNQSSNLNVHMRTHTGERPYGCNMCNESFTTSAKLKTHARKHTGDMPFSCNICGRLFGEKHLLKMHQRIHKGTKSFMCSHCGKAFTHSSTLRAHVRIHTGIKPYVCNVCNQAFAQVSSLTYHKRTHSGEKPYSCHICGNSYTRMTTLNIHLSRHAGQKRISCPHCSFKCDVPTALKKHLEKLHADMGENTTELVLKQKANRFSNALYAQNFHPQSPDAKINNNNKNNEGHLGAFTESSKRINIPSLNKVQSTPPVLSPQLLFQPIPFFRISGNSSSHFQSHSEHETLHGHVCNINTSASTSGEPDMQAVSSSTSITDSNNASVLPLPGIEVEKVQSSQVLSSLNTGDPYLHARAVSQAKHICSMDTLSVTSATINTAETSVFQHPAVTKDSQSALGHTGCWLSGTGQAHDHHQSGQDESSLGYEIEDEAQDSKMFSMNGKYNSPPPHNNKCNNSNIVIPPSLQVPQCNLTQVPQAVSASPISVPQVTIEIPAPVQDKVSGLGETCELEELTAKLPSSLNSTVQSSMATLGTSVAELKTVESTAATLSTKVGDVLKDGEDLHNQTSQQAVRRKQKTPLKTCKKARKTSKKKSEALQHSRKASKSLKLKQTTRNSNIKNLPKHVSGLKLEKPANIVKIRRSKGNNQCSVCGQVFSRSGNLTTHMRLHSGERPYLCNICDMTFTRSDHLKNHQMIHGGDCSFTCHRCGEILSGTEELRSHTDDKHNGEHPFGCDLCQFSCLHLSELKNHMKRHDMQDDFTCNVCNVHFPKSKDLKTHMKSHPGAKPYECTTCQKSFRESSCLKLHVMMRHTGSRPFKCRVCNQGFITAARLQSHTTKHTGHRAFACEFCGKLFQSMALLKMHIKIHTNERPYKCKECDASFTHRSTLRAHVRIHTGTKPYRCDVCGDAFAQISSLTYHKRTHDGLKPYKCHVCGNAYTRSTTLSIHLSRHTGQKRVTCTQCNFKCDTQKVLRQHEAKAHGSLSSLDNAAQNDQIHAVLETPKYGDHNLVTRDHVGSQQKQAHSILLDSPLAPPSLLLQHQYSLHQQPQHHHETSNVPPGQCQLGQELHQVVYTVGSDLLRSIFIAGQEGVLPK